MSLANQNGKLQLWTMSLATQNGDARRWALGLANWNSEVRLWTMSLVMMASVLTLAFGFGHPKMPRFSIGP